MINQDFLFLGRKWKTVLKKLKKLVSKNCLEKGFFVRIQNLSVDVYNKCYFNQILLS